MLANWGIVRDNIGKVVRYPDKWAWKAIMVKMEEEDVAREFRKSMQKVECRKIGE